MNPEIYQEMAKVEDGHWWFRARRAIVSHVLSSLKLAPGTEILDAGSGTGGNLAMLSRFGKVHAMELDAGARALANARGIVTVEEGKLPAPIPFPGQQFDLVVMMDVLEHIDEDAQTLAALHARLKPGGRLLLTVPAFAFLWSDHDVLHHHKRRYQMKGLKTLVENTGFKVERTSHINFWLFPLIASVRLLNRVTGGAFIRKASHANHELKMPPSWLNSLLEQVFASERALIDTISLPFGVSIVLLARK